MAPNEIFPEQGFQEPCAKIVHVRVQSAAGVQVSFEFFLLFLEVAFLIGQKILHKGETSGREIRLDIETLQGLS